MKKLTNKLRKNFAVLILSYGRADSVITIKTLRRCGYTGKIYLVVSDDDPQIDEYRKRYSDILVTFNRKEASENVDAMDNLPNYRGVIYARNSCFKIAKELNLDYFLELDDDYREFSWRWGKDDELKQTITNQLDSIFEIFLQFLDDSGTLTVALSQNGDFIGGLHGSNYQKELTRKAMNAFFCKTDRPFKFFGRINEDTNMYVYYGSIGKLVFTSMLSSLEQEPTQQNNNGMTNLYLDYGTYLKSFYSVMMNPSVVSLMKMGDVNMRIHHKVNWKYLTPKIISDRYKK